MSQNHNENYQGILVSDFDGTMSQYDFYDLASQEFPDIKGNFWMQYEAGEITHFEGLRSIFAGIQASKQQVWDLVDRMNIDPKAGEMIDLSRRNGWDVCIASAGCDWYIKRLLKSQNIEIELYTNHGEYIEGQGLVMTLPEESRFFSKEVGINKLAVVKEALGKYSKVAFAGDGRPDLAPALLVPAHRRFARHWLAKKLTELGEGFHPFEKWSEVVLQLKKQENWNL